jgi:hypothetical protein
MSKKRLSLMELRAEQLRIAAAVEAAEKAEKELIGERIQAVTGMDTWIEIHKNYEFKKKDEGQKMPIGNMIFPKNENSKTLKPYQNLFWIFDKNSHKVGLKSIVFNSLSVGKTVVVTLASGRCETLSFTDFPQLIAKIVQMIDAPRHKKEQMRRYVLAIKKKEMNAIKGAKNEN